MHTREGESHKFTLLFSSEKKPPPPSPFLKQSRSFLPVLCIHRWHSPQTSEACLLSLLQSQLGTWRTSVPTSKKRTEHKMHCAGRQGRGAEGINSATPGNTHQAFGFTQHCWGGGRGQWGAPMRLQMLRNLHWWTQASTDSAPSTHTGTHTTGWSQTGTGGKCTSTFRKVQKSCQEPFLFPRGSPGIVI